MKLPALFSALLLTAFTTYVTADEIYRCGPTGAEFSQTPCSNGARLEVSDPRTEEQRSQAVALAAKTEAWGLALERDRLATEAAYRPAWAGSLNAPPVLGPKEKQTRAMPRLKHTRLKAAPAQGPLLSVSRHGARSSAAR
ncbi:MAG: hypothetical protein Q7T97_01175 [Burkholderiaceae bacterium]|nr:hypothetical protein [Burkholderiaceae bacterium]